MSIKTYSLRRDGNKRIATNFTVREFRSRCGADNIRIDKRGVKFLQKVRNHFGAPVSITSAFRTAAHNRAVGGAPASFHLTGQAFDFTVAGRTPLQVARYCETILGKHSVRGIIRYDGFVHIDTRPQRFLARHTNGRLTQVNNFGGIPSLEVAGNPHREPTTNKRQGSRGTGVKWVQWYLRRLGNPNLAVDGIFGPITNNAVRTFQQNQRIVVDGIVGPITRGRLRAAR